MSRFSISAAIAATFFAFPAPIDATSASPSPAASTVACTEPVSISPDEAFAHVIDDPRTLAFISYVGRVAPADRGAIVKRSSVPISKADGDEFDAALAGDCAFDEIDYRSSRLEYVVARLWSASDAKKLQNSIRYAMAALVLGDRVTRTLRDARLAVFGTSLDDLDARLSPLSEPSPPCENKTASATSATEPIYPYASARTGAAGTVKILIALDEHGYVRSATLFHTSPTFSGPDQSLVTQSIVSAGTSSYLPAIVDCKRRPGKYLFSASFAQN